jgi:hypothetical protein
MSLLVFAGTYLKHQSMSVYLAALACADSVFLLSLLMHWLTFVSVNVIAVQGVCQLVVYASFCSCFLSIWFLVSCSVERYIAICHPLRKTRDVHDTTGLRCCPWPCYFLVCTNNIFIYNTNLGVGQFRYISVGGSILP